MLPTKDLEEPQLKCTCPLPYIGDRCQIPVDVCKNLCFNGGVCYISHAGVHSVPQCSCKSGFTGRRCQHCAKLTCLNGGTCIREDGKDKCLCAVDYYGNSCEHRNTCSQYCLNGGTCRVGAKQPSCICPPLFTGKKCEIDLCAGNNPDYGCDQRCTCKNEGVCQTIGQRGICNCKDMWGGEHCEVSSCKYRLVNNSFTFNFRFILVMITPVKVTVRMAVCAL